MLLRFVTGTSLFVLVLTGALAAPATRPAVDTLSPRPPSTPQAPSSAPDVTGALGIAAPIVSPLLTLDQAIGAYEKGDIAGGDALAASLTDRADSTTAEWIAIRTAPRRVGFARINKFLSDNPDWPANPSLRRRAEEALYNERADAETIRRFFAASRPQTDEGKIALAGALLKSGAGEEAGTLIRDAYRNDDMSDRLEAEIIGNYSDLLSRADHKFRADRLIYDEDYDDGLRAAGRAGSDVAALARLKIAAARRAANASRLLVSLTSSDPSALYARIRILRRQDKNEEAAALLKQAPTDIAALVRPDAWWIERRLVARDLLDAGDARAAYGVVSGYASDKDISRMDAEFLCGWIALRFLNDPAAAARHFAVLTSVAERPISVARGAYWQGRAAEARGGKDEAASFYQAAARYPTTYYGQLARAALGIHSLDLSHLPDIPSNVRSAFDDLPAIRAIERFYALGKRGYARSLILDEAKNLQDNQQLVLLGQLALTNLDARTALLVGKSAMQRGQPLEAIAFPTGAIPGFEGAGDVESAVVYGVARQESEFAHDAVSGAGARGLMQVMPATARATAKAAGISFDAARLTSDAAYNARIGEAHLGDLIERYRGSYIMTFAAYNAGPGRVTEWVKAYGDPRDPNVDPIDWVERIPFSETRNYVQRVMENVQVYRARLGAESDTMAADLRRGIMR